MTEEEILHAARQAEALADQRRVLTKAGHSSCKICGRVYIGHHICIGEHNESIISRHMDDFGGLIDKQFRKGVLNYEAITGRFDSHEPEWYLNHALEELADMVHYLYGAMESIRRERNEKTTESR